MGICEGQIDGFGGGRMFDIRKSRLDVCIYCTGRFALLSIRVPEQGRGLCTSSQ